MHIDDATSAHQCTCSVFCNQVNSTLYPLCYPGRSGYRHEQDRLATSSLDVCRKGPVQVLCTGEKLSESRAADVRELCTTLLNAYLIQLLETGHLHADPHPGNLIRTPDGK